MNLDSSIRKLTPTIVWQFFADIAAVPRPSKREQQIRHHVLEVAKQHGLAAREDRQGNIVIDVAATKGCENAPVTVIQGHLDMVCEKNDGTAHDFDTDPIEPVTDVASDSNEPIVRARGTTLGADNGIGVALALAAATADDVVRPPLELLLTLDEEAGMSGAKALAPDSFRGRRMLNLDSEEDDSIYIGCAGGCDTTLEWQLARPAIGPDAILYSVAVNGLRGGHSGGDIHEGRASAIRLLARTVSGVENEQFRIAELQGGRVRNAIPREARAVIVGDAKLRDRLQAAAVRVQAEAIGESGDLGTRIVIEPHTGSAVTHALSVADSRRIVAVLTALPHGVLGLHPKVPGLVETSNNIATVRCTDNGDRLTVDISMLSRSSSVSRLHETLAQLTAIGELSGATVSFANEYAGWDPNPDSATLATCRRVYRELFGDEPKVLAIHAGLECGVIGERVPGMDMVSFGPRIEGAHSPDEHVYVRSVEKCWKYLTAVLAALAKG